MFDPASLNRNFRVYVRWRPLLGDEAETNAEIKREIVMQNAEPGTLSALRLERSVIGLSGRGEWERESGDVVNTKTIDTETGVTTTPRVAATGASASRAFGSAKKTSDQKPWQSSSSFTRVFESEDSNKVVYDDVINPYLRRVMAGQRCNYFAYGHSGSGKTHTIIGYDDDNDAGLCLSTARAMFEALKALNHKHGDGDGRHADVEGDGYLGVGIRLYEIRQKSAFDLFNERQECHVREGEDGRVHVRGATEMLEEGKVRVRPIVTRPCWTYEHLQHELRAGLALRSTGSSTIHDESSRTHAVLELEIVSRALLNLREAVTERHSELVPVAKRATDIYLEESMRTLMKDESGKWVTNPDIPRNDERVDAAEAQKREYEIRFEEAEAAVSNLLTSSESTPALGGRFVFVDLAGAEYFGDNRAATTSVKNQSQTPQDRAIGRQINSDLFALKEVIRARALKQARIPFRSSPLTMVLREHFLNSNDENSAMILTVSPSADMWNATVNTLKYGALVGRS